MIARLTRIVRRSLSTVALLACVTASAHAQVQPPPPASTRAPLKPAPAPQERGFVSIGFGAQTETPAFSETQTFPLYAEEGTVRMRYDAKGGNAFDLGGGARIWRHVFVGAAWSSTSHRHDVDASASLPHPFRFNDFRTVEGTRTGLQRKESSLHVLAIYRIRVAQRVRVGIHAGPSWIMADQDVAERVTYEEQYPFDTVAFGGVSVAGASATARTIGFGGNVSVDIFGPVSVNVQVRRAAATVDFDTPDGGTVRAKVGGTQIVAGAIVTF